MRRKSKPSVGAEAAKGLIADPEIRQAAAEAAPPVAKLSLSIGKRFARRRTRRQLEQLGETINTLATTLATYGPALAQQIGVIEPPKKKRRKRLVPIAAGGALAAGGAAVALKQRN
ncbi:MAG TPA: hypothetical protein VG410_14750 [Solirubrobacteraceae bacterium]|jgi:hypothetical protein|nr:hypothetical protein [Solirubrobacteraceae bacterium]